MTVFPVAEFAKFETPFYYYDTDLLGETLGLVSTLSKKYGYHVHYAVKANANPRILSMVKASGLGVDCVSGGEISAALSAGFEGEQIMFAGVGKDRL